MTEGIERAQLRAELAHWRGAIAQLTDLEGVAAPEAWAQLEDYLRLRLRDRLLSSITALSAEAGVLAASLDTQSPPSAARAGLLRIRDRYLAVEAIVEFYGDAVQQRTTPRLGAILRGLDTIAVDAMDAFLRPLGIETPAALCYPSAGAGASILKAGMRLFDRGGLSPVAAIGLTRHNFARPTAIGHEASHQTFHLCGWPAELGRALTAALAPRSTSLAARWRSWVSELAADVGSFALMGWAPVPALANVVDGPTPAVHRIRPGDPHPPAWLRVILNVQLCRSWFGTGPWDDLGEAWRSRHDPSGLAGADAEFAAASLSVLPEVADICTRHPFAAFGSRPLSAIVDPGRVSPTSLAALRRSAGDSLLTSTFLARRDSLRILAVLTSEQPLEPDATLARTRRLHDWLARLAPLPLPRAA